MTLRADTQIAAHSLLSLEKFIVGGEQTVRGYRENLLVRDSGFIASLEFRIPIFPEKTGASRLWLAAFSDYGRSWNKVTETPNPDSISSAGLGL